jgi:hypothetical protein
VQITENGCVGTSACENVTGIGIAQLDNSPALVLHPNPTNSRFTIGLINSSGNATVEVFNPLIQKISEPELIGMKVEIDLSPCTNGVSIVMVHHENGTLIERLVLER